MTAHYLLTLHMFSTSPLDHSPILCAIRVIHLVESSSKKEMDNLEFPKTQVPQNQIITWFME